MKHGGMVTWTWDMETSNRKQKMEAHVIFLNPLTVCSSCKQKFVVCPIVEEETNRSYLIATGLNGVNGLAHLCVSANVPTYAHFPLNLRLIYMLLYYFNPITHCKFDAAHLTAEL